MKNISIGLLMFIIISCNNDKLESDTPVLKIESKTSTKLILDSIASFSRSIALETSEESLIGQIKKAWIADSSILVWDSQLERILQFDSNGKYLRQIGYKGHAPNEYITTGDVYFDKEFIYISDIISQRIIIYDIRGEFIMSKQLDLHLYNIYIVKNKIWGVNSFQSDDKYFLVCVNLENGRMEKGYFQSPVKFPISKDKNFAFDEPNNSLLFSSTYEDIIYKIADDEISPILSIDFGKMKRKLKSEEFMTQIQEKEDKYSYLGDIHNVFCHGDKLFFSYFQKKAGEGNSVLEYNVYVSLNNLDPLIYTWNIEAKSDIGCAFLPNILNLSEGYLIFEFNPNIVPEEILEKHLPEKYKKLVGTDSNPILLFYKLRE